MGISIMISEDPIDSGYKAGVCIADLLNDAIDDKGNARMILSAEPDLFNIYNSLLVEDVDWSKVEVFQLCEYINESDTNFGILRKKLDENFISKIEPKAFYYLNGNNTQSISELLSKEEVDVAVIGIGKNTEFGFNYSPADFDSTLNYKIINNDKVTMLPLQIMKSRHIISVVSNKEKKEAVYRTITEKYSKNTPSSILKLHSSWFLFLDYDSSEKLLNLEVKNFN